MKKIFTLLVALLSVASLAAAEKSFTIEFGAEQASTNSLTNESFLSAVKSGQSHISEVTSVLSVFPETNSIKLSSAKKSGGFNIHLAPQACIDAKRIEIVASRYDNDRDADAGLYINSESIDVPDLEATQYTVDIVARPLPVLSNLVITADKRVYIYSITIVYDSENGNVPDDEKQVATPVITPGSSTVTAGTLASIFCPTPDAKIYYTLDGTQPSALAHEYVGPVAIESSLTLKAIALLDGYKPSDVAEAEYSVEQGGSEINAEFNFNNPTTLNPSVEAPAQKESVLLDGRTFTCGDVAVAFHASESGNTHVRLYGSYDAGCDLRIYDGEDMVVESLNPGLYIKSITVETSTSGNADVDFVASCGEWLWTDNAWNPGEEKERSVTLTSVQQSRIANMRVVLDNINSESGVEAVETDTPALYYDLAGRRLAGTPQERGIYIMFKGMKRSVVAF